MYIFFVLIVSMFSRVGSFVTRPPVTYIDVSNDLDAPEIVDYSMPESCSDINVKYCFDNSSYPIDEIRRLLKDIDSLEVDSEFIGSSPDYTDRNGDEVDCLEESTSDLIYYVRDRDNNDRVVVQLEGRFQQRYSITSCKNAGPLNGRTAHFSNMTVQRSKLTCKNKYTDYEFLVLSLKNINSLERISVSVPICCACTHSGHNYL